MEKRSNSSILMVLRLKVVGCVGQARGKLPKTYQTPYGMVEIKRHVYQTSDGGRTLCPLEVDARIIITATPKFAQQISHKYGSWQLLVILERKGMIQTH
ncbi:hypothetical protein B7486_50790 [cyanobacterium TDX16]|nr:hypothetical protein B7486_50790 [cyanobacterium TDX16]